MLIAYVDDSGTDGKGHGCVLSGYVASREQWELFSSRWAECLAREPAIEYFKMQEASSRQGEFYGWTVQDRDAKVAGLAALIREHVELGITVVVWWNDFREFQKMIPYPINAYTLLFNRVIVSLLRHLAENSISDTIQFVFDNQGALGAKAGSLFEKIHLSMPSEYKERLAGPPIHRDDKYTLPLQAADMIAWSVRRSMAEKGVEPTGVASQLGHIKTVQFVFTPGRLTQLALDVNDMAAAFPTVRSMFTEEELLRVKQWFMQG